MKKLGLNDILETERCIIKIPEESEAEYMWNLITEQITKYMIWDKGDTHEITLKNIQDTQKNALEGKTWDAAIYDKNTKKCIGRCGMNRIDDKEKEFELGYWISEKYWGEGIMPECIKRYLEFGFKESSFERVVLKCDSKNINSQKVALKCGFLLEQEVKSHERINGKLRDTRFFGITRDQYLNNK